MTYQETIKKIHEFNKFGSKLGLERMSKLMELLGNPQDEMKVIHVGGTNGKGSVCRYVYSILQENGYKVGLYTSPYLERFTERIEFDGQEISQEDLVTFSAMVFEKTEEMIRLGYDSPTEFELVTAIGFCYFKSKNIDFLVLEVGLGGTGDSTNIIKKPVVTAITSISYDHTEYLGHTLEKIAAEKAGIFKEGVPVVSNVKEEAAGAVIREKAERLNCLFYGYPLGKVENLKKSIKKYSFDLKDSFDQGLNGVELSMIGMHQVENALCAIGIIRVLQKNGICKIEGDAFLEGLKNARQKGRMEILRENPYLIIDGAHNEGGAHSLAQTMHEHFPKGKILLVTGVLADKKLEPLLTNFEEITRDFIVTEPDNPRKMSADSLNEVILARGNRSVSIDDPLEAVYYALRNKNYFDVILVAGSLYLIGKIRGILKDEI